MKVLDHFDDPAAYQGGIVAIGNFDGVHRGHQQMLSTLVQLARLRRVPAVAFTFDPSPLTLLRPELSKLPLMTTRRKLDLFEELGVETTIVYRTDLELLHLSPEEFFTRIVLGELRAGGLVEGPNFCFGRDRRGTIALLQQLCAQAGLLCTVIEPVQMGGSWVSSSTIRQALLTGEVSRARQMLGRPHSAHGLVVAGAHRGRSLGFPTANLAQVATLLPAEGVYAGRVSLAGRCYAAAINLGPNPTFAEQQQKFEVHLLDFAGDLYGQGLTVEFLDRLRDIRPFACLQELSIQLQADCQQTARIVAAS